MTEPWAQHDVEPPPFLGTWRNVYTMVVIYLIALIAAGYGMTRAFDN